MRDRVTRGLEALSRPRVALGGALVIALLLTAGGWLTSRSAPIGTYEKAVRAPITGSLGSARDLSFEITGRVVEVKTALNATVAEGSPLIALDTAQLSAARAGAIAAKAGAEATLASLQEGTRPQELAFDEAAVTQATESLRSALRSAYNTVDTVVHTDTDPLFTNPRTDPLLVIAVPDLRLTTTITAERASLEPDMVAWGTAIGAASFSADDPTPTVSRAKDVLAETALFLDHLTQAISALPSGTAPVATTAVAPARTQVAGALSTLIAAETGLKNAMGTLTIARAGATSADLSRAQAQIEVARAALESANVAYSRSVLMAPVSGTVTALTVTKGDLVAPGELVISIDASGVSKQAALVVPSSAILTDAGTSFVYRKDAGRAVKTTVTVGLQSADGRTEILSGLSEGDEVLVFGS